VKTTIITPELPGLTPSGGIGTFVWHFSRLLRRTGDDVVVIITQPGHSKRSIGLARYEKAGIQVRVVAPRMFAPGSVGAWDFVSRSHGAADAIPADTDIVYVQDWLGDGFVPIRRARQSAGSRPVFVNVLHSPTAWIREAMCEYPRHVLQDMSRDFAERYVAEHADFVASPSAYMLDWVREQGWKLPTEDKAVVLGYPLMQCDEATSPLAKPFRNHFTRIAFLGRYEVRKGIDLFVSAVNRLHHISPERMSGVQEIAFVGPNGNVGRMPPCKARRLLAHTGKTVCFHRNLDTAQMLTLLEQWASDTLVVIPSLDDNYPYVAIEASLVPCLNILYARTGGIPEILPAAGSDSFFPPYEESLANAIDARLAVGLRPLDTLPQYDWQSHNKQWIEFHKQVAASVPVSRQTSMTTGQANQQVDICIPFFNHGPYLPQLLDALAGQTIAPRSITVIDDNSTDAESRAQFADISKRYADRDWRFETLETNRGVSAVRNTAAARGDGEYLLFLDSDNVPVPNMIEQYITAITASDDDCLTCYLTAFVGSEPPYTAHPEGGITPTDRAKYSFLPLGACTTLGLFDNFFGDASFIVRRSVFNQLGGFCEDDAWRYATHEDYDFLLRLVLAGYRLDVVPEVLFYYRLTGNSLIRTTDEYRNRLRIQRTYARRMRDANLPGLVPYLAGMHDRGKPVEFLLSELRQAVRRPFSASRQILSGLFRRLSGK
jgi:O-antigen biosynthesis protein